MAPFNPTAPNPPQPRESGTSSASETSETGSAAVEISLPKTLPEQVAALTLLFSRFPVEEQQQRREDALQSASRGTLDLSRFFLARIGEEPVGAALGMLQPDGSYLVWPPVVASGSFTPEVTSGLWTALVSDLQSSNARLGQVLLGQQETEHHAPLTKHGFRRAAGLFFLACALDPQACERQLAAPVVAGRPHRCDDVDLEWIPCSGRPEESRLARIIEETYIDSLDVPLLAGLRNGREAIETHRLSGVFDPTLWLICRMQNRDAGVLLLAEHPDQQALELVYMGIAPWARGQKLGQTLVEKAIEIGRSREQQAIFLADDAANRYANSVYESSGFTEIAQREVWLWLKSPPDDMS